MVAIAFNFFATLFATLLHRVQNGPARPTWGLLFETTVNFLRKAAKTASGRPVIEQRAVWAKFTAQPSPTQRGPGCAFAPRCDFANARCRAERPAFLSDGFGHGVACFADQEGRLPESLPAVALEPSA